MKGSSACCAKGLYGFAILIAVYLGLCECQPKMNVHLGEEDPETDPRSFYVHQGRQKAVEKRHMLAMKDVFTLFRKRRVSNSFNYTWPIKHVAEIEGDVILGGLMMVHEREDRRICGPIMPQGGIQALECMLYTMDWVNNQKDFLPGIKLGAYVLDDCDKDTYGLEQAVDFIKGKKEIL